MSHDTLPGVTTPTLNTYVNILLLYYFIIYYHHTDKVYIVMVLLKILCMGKINLSQWSEP